MSKTDTATRGSLAMFLSLTRPIAVLHTTLVPSVSAQTGVSWGEPSGLIVAICAKFLPLSSATALALSFADLRFFSKIVGGNRLQHMNPSLRFFIYLDFDSLTSVAGS